MAKSKTRKVQSEDTKPAEFRRPRVGREIAGVEPLLFSFDMGTGECKGFSSDFQEIIRFAPVIAPMSDKRAVKGEENKPTYSLKANGQVEVFGVEDVFDHGKTALLRRLSSLDRYLDQDYYKLFKVMLLHAFKRFVSQNDFIRPSGVVSIPVSLYNDEEKFAAVQDALCGKYEIADVDGCILRVEIVQPKLLIIPEGYGEMQHYAFSPTTLEKREGVTTGGTTILIDIGYETVNMELYEGMKYIKDKAYTIPRAGNGIIVRRIAEWAATQLRGVDVSRIDKGLRAIAGKRLGEEKMIEVAPGIEIDVQHVYDEEIINLAKKISDGVLTHYPESANRALLGGGTAYHVSSFVETNLEPMQVVIVPDADVANSLGSLTKLYRELVKRQSS